MPWPHCQARKGDLCQQILIPVCRSPVLGRKEHYMSRSPCVKHTKYFTCESKDLCICGQERCMEEEMWMLQSLWDKYGSQLCLWLYIHKIKICCKAAVAKSAFGEDREWGRVFLDRSFLLQGFMKTAFDSCSFLIHSITALCCFTALGGRSSRNVVRSVQGSHHTEQSHTLCTVDEVHSWLALLRLPLHC